MQQRVAVEDGGAQKLGVSRRCIRTRNEEGAVDAGGTATKVLRQDSTATQWDEA